MNEEEKRKKAECFCAKGLSWEEANNLVELTEKKQRGEIDKYGQQRLTELMVELALLLPHAP